MSAGSRSIGGCASKTAAAEVPVAWQQRSMADRIAGAGVVPVGRGACVGKKPAASREKASTLGAGEPII